ncbi:MAG: hypothetical protein WDZ30_04545 [Cellvibrionaceae bacterium]
MMNTFKIFTLLILMQLVTACAAIDYQSLNECATQTEYAAIEKDSTTAHATIESIPADVFNSDGSWFAYITHVDCAKVQDPWQIVRVPARPIKARVKFNPEAAALSPIYPGVSVGFENVAQWLDFSPEPGLHYELHVKTLARWDMAYWITLNGELVAHTDNFKPSFRN